MNENDIVGAFSIVFIYKKDFASYTPYISWVIISKFLILTAGLEGAIIRALFILFANKAFI